MNISTHSLFCIEWIYASKYRFKGVFWCTYKLPHLHCDKSPLQSTCLSSPKLPHLYCDKLPLQKYLPKQSMCLMGEGVGGGGVLENWILVCFHSFLVIKWPSQIFSIKITILWCIFIVYTSINGVTQGIVSIVELSFFVVFYIDKMTTLKWPVHSVISSVLKIWPSPGLKIWNKYDCSTLDNKIIWYEITASWHILTSPGLKISK